MSTKKDRIVTAFFILCTTVFLEVFCIDNSKNYGIGKLKYCNPLYITNCSVISYSKMIGGQMHMLTNYSFTPIVPLGNNVTVTGLFLRRNGIPYKVEHKFCDYFRQPWLVEYFKGFYKDRMPCPWPTRKFELNDVELPPKNFSVPMKPGIYEVEGEVFRTVSKERIMTLHYTINFVRQNKSKRTG